MNNISQIEKQNRDADDLNASSSSIKLREAVEKNLAKRMSIGSLVSDK